MRGNEGVDIRKIKEGGESLKMIAMVSALANQKPRSPPCPRTRRHCRPKEDPNLVSVHAGERFIVFKIP